MQSNAASSVTLSFASAADRDEVHGMLRAYLTELGSSPDYPYLPLYWSEAGRFPYLIKMGQSTSGFALVRRLEDGAFEVAEFYVAHPWRRCNVGRAAVAAVLAAHPGRWRLRSFPGNAAAEAFWSKVVPPGADRRVVDGAVEYTFRIDSAG